MIKTRKVSYPPIHMGTSLMLVIFIILCMIIFSVLSLSSALKDWNYSEKNASRTQAYYKANNQAEEILAQIDTTLYGCSSLDACAEQLQSMNLSVTHVDDSLSVSYFVAINDTEFIEVALSIHPEKVPKYNLLTWKQISTSNWDGDQSLPVYGSD